jgi:hypothetical protein
MADEGGSVMERELTICNGALAAGGLPTVGEAVEVVQRDEGKVRSVPQQIREEGTEKPSCPFLGLIMMSH